ncbi:MAG: acyl-CoA thioesterase [Fibrobacterota bacterium]
MESFTIVRPEHLNHHGYLFGGALLKWVDEFAWIAASRDLPGCTLVTMAMDTIVFRKRVANGAILRFAILQEAKGTTSVTYSVRVYTSGGTQHNDIEVFSTSVTFVCVDEKGQKKQLTV